MKLNALIMIIAVILISAKAHSQVINMEKSNISLRAALTMIENQTGYAFMARNFDLNHPLITVSIKNATLREAINKCIEHLPLTYTIIGKNVVFSYIKPPEADPVPKALPIPLSLHGRVLDENGIPLSGATVQIKGSRQKTISNDKGDFNLSTLKEDPLLVISHTGYHTKELPGSSETGDIRMELAVAQLQEVEISTGYQKLEMKNTTGSYTVIDSSVYNRAVSPDFLSRLKSVTSGQLFDPQTGNVTGISIRGRSTLFSETKPLIVVDQFPFEGDLNTINPNDIENVSILKDAAAAAIWGVRAGNGVISVTTKSGKYNQKTIVTFNVNTTIGNPPDLYARPQLSSSEYIDLEKYLFSKGWYNVTLRNDYEVISPVIALLSRQNTANAAATQAAIESLKQYDIRQQMAAYLYQKSIQQQYYLSLSGGGSGNSYHLSAGYDHDRPSTVGATDERFTLKANNTYDLITNRIQLSVDIAFNRSVSHNRDVDEYKPFLPYEQLADQNGNPLNLLLLNGLRASYTDTAGNGRLLNWKYAPLEELRQGSNSLHAVSNDIKANTALRYKIITPLTFSLNYQYYNSSGLTLVSRDINSFSTRDAINEVTQINRTTGAITYPIPPGGTLRRISRSFNTGYGRAQFDFIKTFSPKHQVNAIAGYEIRAENYDTNTLQLYGYDESTETSAVLDPVNTYPYYYGSGTTKLPGNLTIQNGTVNNYISWYANAVYVYDKRYILSGSYRKDESNLFGVRANEKGVPLFSTGLAWNLNNEKFYQSALLPRLKLRASYGYNGNVNKSISAFTTAAPNLFPNYWNTPFATIINPPNPSLRWERVQNINFGLDFGLKKEVVSGSIDYYIKNGVDLIGVSPVAQQTGISTFTGNVANSHTNGFDIQLNSSNLTSRNFRWYSTLIVNLSKDKVTRYQLNKGSNIIIVSGNSIQPIVGYPINAMFSFKSAGLDKEGNPQGILDGQLSENYTAMTNSTNIDNLKYEGSMVPTIFGSLRNTFNYRNFGLSFNISYKLGYLFRLHALQYNLLFNGDYQFYGYGQRWQKPGDENITRIPSMIYPASISRDEFYSYSEDTSEKGDHIRLNDLQLVYSFPEHVLRKNGLSSFSLYVYASNLGILWRANQYRIDPDVQTGLPVPKSISLGIKTNF